MIGWKRKHKQISYKNPCVRVDGNFDADTVIPGIACLMEILSPVIYSSRTTNASIYLADVFIFSTILKELGPMNEPWNEEKFIKTGKLPSGNS